MTYAKELALRSAVATVNRDFDAGTNQIDELQKMARLKALDPTENGSESSMQSNMKIMAINAALNVLNLAYTTIKEQLRDVKSKRLSFDKEISAGIASFSIRNNVEARDLSEQSKAIINFVDLVNKNFELTKFFGIHKGTLSESNGLVYYTVVPFYKVQMRNSNQLNSRLDKERQEIQLFLDQAVPNYLEKVDSDFLSDNRVVEYCKSIIEKDNYLNNLRSVRFVIICLSNLLWNLQYPVNPSTGYALGLDACSQLCQKAKTFLNTILNDEDSNSLKALNTKKNDFSLYIRKVERYIKNLISTYEAEKVLCELNISDLCANAHSTLKTMDLTVFELIYSFYNPSTGKREDSKAADALVVAINNINHLMEGNNRVLTAFSMPKKAIPCLNDTVSTLMDVLIIFSHSDSNERNVIYTRLKALNNDDALDFKKALEEFYSKFIRPIKHVNRKELKANLLSPRTADIATLTGKKLLPLISLIINNYEIDVELENNHFAMESGRKYTANQQVNSINRMAERGEYYLWSLPLPTQLKETTDRKLTSLLKQQYRFSKLTKLLDSVQEIVKSYRNFLQQQAFQQFLKRCLEKVKDEFSMLSGQIKELHSCLSRDSSKTRAIEAIMDKMSGNLTESIYGCLNAVRNIEVIISDPAYFEKQRQLLSSAFNFIHSQFVELFQEDSGISSFITNNNLMYTPMIAQLKTVPHTLEHKRESKLERINTSRNGSLQIDDTPLTLISREKAQVLKALVSDCYNAMSKGSQQSVKGANLRTLMQHLESMEEFMPRSFTVAIKELAGITLNPRRHGFFTAGYAATRSSKPLITALKNARQNRLLALDDILLGSSEDLSQETDSQIIKRLQGRRGALQGTAGLGLLQ